MMTITERLTIEDGEGRGYIQVTLNEHYAYVHGLRVFPEYRRQGIATALLTAAIRRYGMHAMELIVTPGDGPGYDVLVRLYEKHGFRHGPTAHPTRLPRHDDDRRMIRLAAPAETIARLLVKT